MNAPIDAAASGIDKKDAADERIAQLEAQVAQLLAAGGQPSTPLDVDSYEKVERENPRIQMTLRELRAYEGTLYVKHNDPARQFSCHQALGEHRVDFDLGPSGGSDNITILPKLALEIRGIQRAWKRGVITISTDEAMEEEIDLMMNQHASYSQELLAELQVKVEPNNNERDIVTRPCLRCGRYGRDERNQATLGIEGGQSFMKFADYKAGRAPLCDAHQHEEHLWVGTLITDPQSGAQDWKFQSLVVGESQPGVPQQQPYQGPIPQRMYQ